MMKETIDLLGKILTNILTALYEPFGFSFLLSFLAMFFYLYAYKQACGVRPHKESVKRKTSKKKFAKKCREVNLLLVKMRTCRLKEIIAKLNQILTGYYHYYGITDNTESITAFRYNIMRSLFYCLNRRSQKKSYNWVEFLNMLDNNYPLVSPRIYVNIYE